MRNKLKIFFFFISILILLTNCQKGKKHKIVNTATDNITIINIQNTDKTNCSYQKICTLFENIDIIGSIQSFCFTDKRHFAVATKEGIVYIYDLKGNQIRTIGSIGEGPSQFYEPAILKAYNNYLYIWDSKLLKMLIYTPEGKFIEERKDFKKAITNFDVCKDLICFYTTCGFQQPFIEIYDIRKKSILRSMEQPTEEDLMLGLNSCIGGIAIEGEHLLYTSFHEPVIHKINIRQTNDPGIVMKVDDPDFKVETVKDAMQIINHEPNKIINYLLNNSYVTGLFTTSNGIILKTETGYFKTIKNGIDNSKRFTNIYFLNEQNELKYIITEKHNFEADNKLYVTYDNHFYRLTFHEQIDDSPCYQLEQVTPLPI